MVTLSDDIDPHIAEYIAEYIREVLHMGDLQDFLGMNGDAVWGDFQLYLDAVCGIKPHKSVREIFLREWRKNFIPEAKARLTETGE